MHHKGLLVLAIVLVLSLLAGLACAGGQPATTSAPETPAKETTPIKIGFMGNLSSASSLSAKAAAQLAVDEFNAAGGIDGRKVELIVEDTKGEIPKCVELYKKLVMVDKVDLVVIGEKVEMGVAGMETGAELYPEYPHIFINTTGSGDVIWQKVATNYNKYKFGFQTYYYTSSGYLTVMVPKDSGPMWRDVIKVKKLALIYEDMEWTKPVRQGIPNVYPSAKEIFKSLGIDVVYESTLSLDQKVFTSVLDDIARSGAEGIDMVVGYIDEAAFVKQWADSSAKNLPIFMWGGLVGMPQAWEATGGKCAGVMVGSSMVREPITEKTVPFMDNLYNKFKVGAIFGSHTTYDSLYGYKKAVETAKTTNAEAVIKAMEKVEEVAVLGTIGWDAKNHYNLPSPKYITPSVQWQNKEMKIVYPTTLKSAVPYKNPADCR